MILTDAIMAAEETRTARTLDVRKLTAQKRRRASSKAVKGSIRRTRRVSQRPPIRPDRQANLHKR